MISDIAYYIPSILILFKKKNLVPTLPTMQLGHWVTSLEAIYQIRGSFL